MKMKRALAVVLALTMTGTMLIGCSGGSTPSNSDGTGSTETTSDGGETESTAAAVTSVIKDVVNVGVSADPGDLSPWGPNNTGRSAVLYGYYQSLGHCIDGEIYGVLMKEYEISDDESQMAVTIYDTEGNHMTASDIVFSFNTCVEIGSINGLSFIDSCEVVDDYTVRFNFADVLYVYDIETLFETVLMVTQASYEASSDGMVTTPVGTGPYKVTKYVSDYITTLKRTGDYWQKDENLIYVRDMANVQTINYYIITESSQMTMALEDGSIDMSGKVNADDLHMFEDGGAQSERYWVYQTTDNLWTWRIPCNSVWYVAVSEILILICLLWLLIPMYYYLTAEEKMTIRIYKESSCRLKKTSLVTAFCFGLAAVAIIMYQLMNPDSVLIWHLISSIGFAICCAIMTWIHISEKNIPYLIRPSSNHKPDKSVMIHY